MSDGANTAAVPQVVECDPGIEKCDPEFLNTIELDYWRSNLIIGITSGASALLPLIIWFIYKPKSTSGKAIFADNFVYGWGWEWLWIESAVIWGIPAFLWSLTLFVPGDALPFMLLVWWTFIQFFASALLFAVGPLAMMIATGAWRSYYDAELQRWEIWTTAVIWLAYGAFSHYLFYTYWVEALLYYDQGL